MRMLLYFIIPILFLVGMYYLFGGTVFTAFLTTILTLLIIGGIGLVVIFKKFIKPLNEKGSIIKTINKFKKR